MIDRAQLTDEVFEVLTHLVVLVQMPRETWTDEDQKFFRSIRALIEAPVGEGDRKRESPPLGEGDAHDGDADDEGISDR